MDAWRALGAFVCGAALVLAAWLFDASPLLVPGVAFMLLGAGAPAWVWFVALGVSAARKLQQDTVVEGEPLEATLELVGGPLGLPSGEVHDPLAGSAIQLPGGRRATIRLLARFDRRGRKRLAPPRVLVRDPLDLARRRLASRPGAQQVLVLPQTEPVQWSERGGAGAISSASRARADLLAAMEVDGLRPYRQGTSASRIHWPALARGAGLLERRLRVEGDAMPLVVLDARAPDSEEALDAAVRAAASLTLELASAGGCRLLLPGERRALAIEADMLSWPAAHSRLALVEGGPDTRAPSPAGIRAALGSLFYVTAQRLDRPSTAIRADAVAAGTVVLVVPAPLAPGGDRQPSFLVSGCVGLSLGRSGHGARERRARLRETLA